MDKTPTQGNILMRSYHIISSQWLEGIKIYFYWTWQLYTTTILYNLWSIVLVFYVVHSTTLLISVWFVSVGFSIQTLLLLAREILSIGPVDRQLNSITDYSNSDLNEIKIFMNILYISDVKFEQNCVSTDLLLMLTWNVEGQILLFFSYRDNCSKPLLSLPPLMCSHSPPISRTDDALNCQDNPFKRQVKLMYQVFAYILQNRLAAFSESSCVQHKFFQYLSPEHTLSINFVCKCESN